MGRSPDSQIDVVMIRLTSSQSVVIAGSDLTIVRRAAVENVRKGDAKFARIVRKGDAKFARIVRKGDGILAIRAGTRVLRPRPGTTPVPPFRYAWEL
jgi:hypothetical protein